MSLLKTPWEKEKLLVARSFSHSVFNAFGGLSAIIMKFEIVVCKLSTRLQNFGLNSVNGQPLQMTFLNYSEMIITVFEESIVGKGENAHHQQFFSFFPNSFMFKDAKTEGLSGN